MSDEITNPAAAAFAAEQEVKQAAQADVAEAATQPDAVLAVSDEDGDTSLVSEATLAAEESEYVPPATFEDFSEQSGQQLSKVGELKNTQRDDEFNAEEHALKIKEASQEISLLIDTKFGGEDNFNTYSDLLEANVWLSQEKINILLQDLSSDLKGIETKEELVKALSELVMESKEAQEKLAELLSKKLDAPAMSDEEGVISEEALSETVSDLTDDQLDAAIDGVTDATADGTPVNSEDVSTKKGKVKYITGMLKTGLREAGLFTLENFHAKGMGDVEALINFLLNPTGGVNKGLEYSYNEGGKEVLPKHVFKAKFKDFSAVGKALSVSVPKMNIDSWESANRKQLDIVKEGGNAKQVTEVMMSLYTAMLTDSNKNREENWAVFSKEFTTALFGGEKEVHMNEESKLFLADLCSDGGKKLEDFWNLDTPDEKNKPEDGAATESKTNAELAQETTESASDEQELAPDTTDVSLAETQAENPQTDAPVDTTSTS